LYRVARWHIVAFASVAEAMNRLGGLSVTTPYFDPDSLDNRDPAAMEALFGKLDPILERFFSPSVTGFERIPEGPALYVANHNAGLLMPDVFILASALYRARGMRDMPYGLAHDLALRPAVLNRMLCPIGAVRARPGTAERIFARGSKALVYPGGDLEVMRPFSKRDEIVFGPRRGYVKLALKAGVPITPVVTAGAHSTFVVLDDGTRLARAIGLPKWARVHVLPTVLSFPWGLTFGFPPPYLPFPTRIYSEVLPPIRFAWTGAEAADDAKWVEECHHRVVSTMQAALTRLARKRREDRAHDVAEKVAHAYERALDVLGLGRADHASEPASRPAPAPAAEPVSGLDRPLATAQPAIDARIAA
jgi:1-acyl-sn-glycerol-3-phosphate acyltransferase